MLSRCVGAGRRGAHTPRGGARLRDAAATSPHPTRPALVFAMGGDATRDLVEEPIQVLARNVLPGQIGAMNALRVGLGVPPVPVFGAFSGGRGPAWNYTFKMHSVCAPRGAGALPNIASTWRRNLGKIRGRPDRGRRPRSATAQAAATSTRRRAGRTRASASSCSTCRPIFSRAPTATCQARSTR